METKKRPLRTLSVLLTVAVLFGVFACLPVGAAETLTEGDYKYTVENGEATITEYTGNGGDVTIPSTLGGYPVKVIGDRAFETIDEVITGITLPDGLEVIEDEALAFLEIKNITLPASLKSIGDFAFRGTDITSITIPKNVTKIGYGVFSWCQDLSSITVEAGNTNYEAVNNCLIKKETGTLLYGGDNAVIPDGVKVIESYAFSQVDVTTIIIPNSVTTIWEYAFYECYNRLKSVFIPNSVTYIDWNVFSVSDDCTIYCEAPSMPEGWDEDWGGDDATVVWGAKMPEPKPSIKGDIGGDGAVDTNDYLLLKRTMLGTFTPTDEQRAAADLNGDGSVDTIDYLLLKRVMLGTYVIK